MKINQKLITGYILISLFVLAIGIIGIIASERLVENYIGSVSSIKNIQIEATKVSSFAKRIEGHLFLYLFLNDEIDKSKFFSRNESLLKHFSALKDNIHIEEGEKIIADLGSEIEKILYFGKQLIRVYEKDLENNKQIFSLEHQDLFRAFHSATSKTRESAIELAALNYEFELKKEEKVLRGLIGFKNGIIIVVLISFALALFMGRALSKSIVTPINRLRKATEEMTEGNLNPLLEIESKDEIGKLIESFSAMGREIKLNEEALKKSLEEKETLLKEVHHRTKNNMQIISSLLSLQSREIKDYEYLEMFKDCSNRINAMSLIHETIYKSSDFSKINFKEFLSTLFDSLFESYGIQPGRIGFVIDSKNIFLDLDSSIPCGLLVQELVSNSLKYAFPDNRQGTIQVSIHSPEEGIIELNVSDDGVGIPEEVDIRNTPSLGLRLVTTLVENQLWGTLELKREHGTEFKIKFPLKQKN